LTTRERAWVVRSEIRNRKKAKFKKLSVVRGTLTRSCLHPLQDNYNRRLFFERKCEAIAVFLVLPVVVETS
jgi:hypothetical protein